MKKLLLALVGVMFMAGNAVAQDYEKNIYGVRAGLNLNTMAGDFSAAIDKRRKRRVRGL